MLLRFIRSAGVQKCRSADNSFDYEYYMQAELITPSHIGESRDGSANAPNGFRHLAEKREENRMFFR